MCLATCYSWSTLRCKSRREGAWPGWFGLHRLARFVWQPTRYWNHSMVWCRNVSICYISFLIWAPSLASRPVHLNSIPQDYFLTQASEEAEDPERYWSTTKGTGIWSQAVAGWNSFPCGYVILGTLPRLSVLGLSSIPVWENTDSARRKYWYVYKNPPSSPYFLWSTRAKAQWRMTRETQWLLTWLPG